MLTSSSDQRPESSGDTTPVERKIAVLGATLSFKGDLSAEEDFILHGRVQGSIYHTQRIIIGTGGVVAGNIHARAVVIDGTVEGDLHGTESVAVHETGRVIGNIFAPRVKLVDGAIFNGRIDMSGTASVTQQPASHTATPAPSQAVSQVVGQVVSQGANQNIGSLALKKRVESPTMSPGLPMSSEQTEKVLTPKVVVVPPSAPREKVG